jgi:hypothetical protein
MIKQSQEQEAALREQPAFFSFYFLSAEALYYRASLPARRGN